MPSTHRNDHADAVDSQERDPGQHATATEILDEPLPNNRIALTNGTLCDPRIQVYSHEKSRETVKIWWFDTRAANRGELVGLVAAALYAISAFLPQARVCAEEMDYRHYSGCRGDEVTVWLEPTVMTASILAAGLVVSAVYLSHRPAKFSDSWNPETSTILVITSVVSLVVASAGAPNYYVLELLSGTWVQVAASVILLFYGLSSFITDVYSKYVQSDSSHG